MKGSSTEQETRMSTKPHTQALYHGKYSNISSIPSNSQNQRNENVA